MSNQKNNNKRSKKQPRRYGEGQSYKSDGMDRDKLRPEKEDFKGRTKGSNDAGWYQADSQLMKDAAQLSFPVAAGRELRVAGRGTGAEGTLRMPGVMSFGVLPTYGEMTDWNSPFNVAIRKTYSWIRHANSGHANYDAADLGQYFISYDSACIYYAWMVRCYGLARTLIVQNAYTPSDLVKGCGMSYDSLVSNLAQFRAYINTYAVRLQALKVPSDLHFIERHMWLFTHVYADAPLAKCSFFMFNPISVWEHVINETDDEMLLSSSLFKAMYNINGMGSLTYEKVVSVGNSLLNNILNNEDFNIMSGDIIKAYGDKIFGLNLISEDYQVTPVYDPEVLLQIRNATVPFFEYRDLLPWFAVDNDSRARIIEVKKEGQNVGTTKIILNLPTWAVRMPSSDSEGTLKQGKISTVLDRVITMPIQSPTPAEVCVATRFTTQWNFEQGTYDVGSNVGTVTCDMLYPKVFGTEVILTAHVLLAPNGDYQIPGADNDADPTKEAMWAARFEKFDWVPSRYVSTVTYLKDPSKKAMNISGVTVKEISGDWDNTTVVARETLDNIHRAAVLGMFDLAL